MISWYTVFKISVYVRPLFYIILYKKNTFFPKIYISIFYFELTIYLTANKSLSKLYMTKTSNCISIIVPNYEVIISFFQYQLFQLKNIILYPTKQIRNIHSSSHVLSEFIREKIILLFCFLFLNDLNEYFVQNNYLNGISIPNYKNTHYATS